MVSVMNFNVNLVGQTLNKEFSCYRLTIDTESGQISIMHQHIDMVTTINSGKMMAFDKDMNVLGTYFFNSGIVSCKNGNCTIITSIV